MPNQLTTVTTQGYGNRIMSAIVGVPIGLLLIVIAIGLLYWNEGRVDPSKIAQKSVPVNSQQVESGANGKFISVTGPVVASQLLGDGTYLQPGQYAAVQRVVEEYAWVEDQSSQSQNNTGGSQTTTTTYTYKEEWTDSVADSSTFHDPTGHQNPAKPLDDTTVKAATAKVGAYTIDPQTISLPSLQPVSLSSSNTILTGQTTSSPPAVPATSVPAPSNTTTTTTPAPALLSNLTLANSTYLFAGSGSLSAPQLGDIRISYLALPAGTNVTVFGLLTGSSLAKYTDPQGYSMYNLQFGDRNTAIATLHNQYETLTWILRVVGIVMIWIGLMMLLAPLNIILDFLPIAGEISGGITLIVTLPLALLIGGTVIIISYTVHHVIALVIAVPVVFLVGIGVSKLIKRGRGLTTAPPVPAGMAAPPTAGVPPVSPAAASPGGSLFAAPAAAPSPVPNPVPPPAPGPIVPPPATRTFPSSAPPPPPVPAVPPSPEPVTPPLYPPGHTIQPGQPPAPTPEPETAAADPFFPPPTDTP
jgi:hypothetical protein